MHLKVSLELPDGTRVHLTHVYPAPNTGDTIFYNGEAHIATERFFDYESSELIISINQQS